MDFELDEYNPIVIRKGLEGITREDIERQTEKRRKQLKSRARLYML